MKSTSFMGHELSVRSFQGKCFIHTYQDNNNSNNSNNSNKEDFIQDLFKDRIAPVIPFDRNLIKGSCLNYTDKVSKAKFLKEWGSKVGIYLIEYKYYPNIYYIGRTNQIKKRLYEHSKAESNSKFHLFMRLTGIKDFNIHILEVCADFFLLFIAILNLLPRSDVYVNNGHYNGSGDGKSICLIGLKSFLGNIQHRRLYSVSRNFSASSVVVPPKPVMVYKNAGVDVERILLENKGKASRCILLNKST